MTTTTLDTRAATAAVRRPRERVVHDPIPSHRLVSVELRKMFDTRAGAWLLAGVGLAAVIATAATVIFAPRDQLTYEAFATAIGVPLSIVLPIIAILAVTGEWSQRNGLTTFALVPHRGRVIAAKAVCVLGVAVVSMLVAAVVGALGNVVGTTIAGVDATWNVSMQEFAQIILANVLGMGVGFMLAVLMRNSAGAIVGFFAYTALLPVISSALASTQVWYHDNAPWFDLSYATMFLYDGSPSAQQWAQLGVASLLWLVIPLVVGLRLVVRAEVK